MSEIVIYNNENNQAQVEVRFEDETVWLTQTQIVTLFESSKANVSEHISHIFESGELEENATVWKFRIVQQEGDRTIFYFSCRAAFLNIYATNREKSR